MATKYKRAGSGNWSADASWSTTSGGAADTVKPTAADDVKLDASSGALTIDAASVCRSLDCTGYTGTLTHNASTGLTIGDATAGAGNIALKFVAGMTYTIGGNTTSTITFISTSATVQTVDFAGKTTANIEFNATSGGSWKYTGAHVCAQASTTVTFTKGTLDLNGQTCTWGTFSSNNSNVRVFTLGAASITILRGDFSEAWLMVSTNLTFSGASSTITFTGTNAQWSSGGSTYGTIISTGGEQFQTSNNLTCTNFTYTGTATKTNVLQLYANITCTGTLTINGNSVTNRVLVRTGVIGQVYTLTAATVSVTHADFRDVTAAGAGSWNLSAITGGSGDVGGNTGITFTTPATQTWSGTSGGNWSTNAWTTRVPLPQDDVVINAAFSASQTITADMPRLGKSIDWTGATGNPTWSLTSTTNTVHGSVTLISGMTLSQDKSLAFAGRGSFTITSAGKQWPSTGGASINFHAHSGTYTLQDAFSTGGIFNVSNGTVVTGGFSITCLTFTSSGTGVRALTLGSSTINITSTSTATVYNTGTVTNLTFSGASATLNISTASANVRTIAPGGLTIGTLTYTVAGSTGSLSIQGSNTFGTINFSDVTNARSLLFTAGTTTTITTSFNVQGTAGKLMTVGSITSATHTLVDASGTVSCDYLSISYSIADGGAAWYAGANSTNGGNNTGWIFTEPVSGLTKFLPAESGVVLALQFEDNLTDLSGNSNNGTLVGGATYDADGKEGKSIILDGSGDYVTVADAASLDFTAGLTVSVWIKQAAFAGLNTIISKRSAYDATGIPFELATDGANVNFRVKGTTDQINVVHGMSTGVWNHIVATWDGTKSRVYVNGVQKAQANISGSITPNATLVGIGSLPSGGENFNGRIDRLFVMSSGRRGDQILAEYNLTPVPAAATTNSGNNGALTGLLNLNRLGIGRMVQSRR